MHVRIIIGIAILILNSCAFTVAGCGGTSGKSARSSSGYPGSSAGASYGGASRCTSYRYSYRGDYEQLPGAAGPAAGEVAYVSRNLDLGFDMEPLLQAIDRGDDAATLGAAGAAWDAVMASDVAGRTRAAAEEIAAVRPEVIALQEAALWRRQMPADSFESDPTDAQEVVFDTIEMLRRELSDHGLDYEVAVALPTLDCEIPRAHPRGGFEDIRLTERLAILVLRADDVHHANVRGAWFEAGRPLRGEGVLPCGWASVDIMVQGKALRVVTTRLEASSDSLRERQARELRAQTDAADLPVLLAGDFIHSDPALLVDFADAGYALAAPDLPDLRGTRDALLLRFAQPLDLAVGEASVLGSPGGTRPTVSATVAWR